MIKNYRDLSSRISNRLNPDRMILEKSFSDELSRVSHNDILVYIRTAMKGVDPAYTAKSRDAGERVKNHLKAHLQNVDYKYQGSVMTNTHIKGYSDIDLLTICNKFYNCQSTQVKNILESYEDRSRYDQSSIDRLVKEHNMSFYCGDSRADLKAQRLLSEAILSNEYSKCDITHPKAIKIRNLSLGRDVDIVIANWYDDVTSVINGKGVYRGVQVYDKDKNNTGNADYPFLSIDRINSRSKETGGRLKRMIRFLKNLKADSNQEIKLSSFDINAICYDIDVAKYINCDFYALVPVLYNQLYSICSDSNYSNKIVSVDGREYIFRFNSEKLDNLRVLLSDVLGVVEEMKKTLIYG